MQVGDLVRYKHRKQDVGIIIDVSGPGGRGVNATYKVLWVGTPSCSDWMRLAGLEVISESR